MERIKMNYCLDVHTHTVASGHAYSTMLEMVASAKEKGLGLLGITEHAPSMPGTTNKIYFENLKVVSRQMGELKLLLGVELNILDYQGNIDLDDYLLDRLDVAIASLHGPCIAPGSIEENTAAVIGAMKNKRVNIIGHPDDVAYPLDYEQVVKVAKETNTILEVNNNSLSPNTFRQNTRENATTMLKLCKQYEVPVIVGSDAHIATDVGLHQNAQEVFDACDFPEHLILNRSVDVFLEALKKKTLL